MTDKFSPLTKVPHMIHGGDYNPDQWLEYPEVLKEDIRLMKLAGINSASVGIFAWAALEPQDGVYTFEWLDNVINSLYENGIYTILATPSGAKPAWLDKKYPDALRVTSRNEKNMHGSRHNHCFTSPSYRRKVSEMNTRLAERYKDHPGIMMWHISNEYSGECHCENCQNAFRGFLRERYDGDISKLNHAWWTYFWSHKYNNFDEIDIPSPLGEKAIHGMNLDWMRFVTYQTKSFIDNETAPLRKITPDIPVTINMMGTFAGLNYWDLQSSIDVASWDSYPSWHNEWTNNYNTAGGTAFSHDINRCFQNGKPFMLMESTPSLVNWQQVCKLKKPGMHLLSSLHAVAHGSDSVQYFQWRKSRGASEKFHGAVVDHVGNENTRVFKEVTQVGDALKKLDDVVGAYTPSQAAIIYDWEINWAVGDLQGLSNKRDYQGVCMTHYKYFRDLGIPVDIISSECDISQYDLVISPMLYLVRDGVSDSLKKYVSDGGTLVTTYLTGYVDKEDLCFLGGFPGGGLRELIGIWAEEIDSLYPSDKNSLTFNGNCGFEGTYEVTNFCELIHAETAEVLASYDRDFYEGVPAVTVNKFGKGKVYHIAAHIGTDMTGYMYSKITPDINIRRPLNVNIPPEVEVHCRTDGKYDYIFVMNFSENGVCVPLESGKSYYNLLTDTEHTGDINMKKYETAVLKVIR